MAWSTTPKRYRVRVCAVENVRLLKDSENFWWLTGDEQSPSSAWSRKGAVDFYAPEFVAQSINGTLGAGFGIGFDRISKREAAFANKADWP